MRLRPTFFVTFLLYVTLDLCVPLVGGAFVFDVIESAEGVQVARTWAPPVLGVAPSLPDLGAAERACARQATTLAVPAIDGFRRVRPVPHRPRASLSRPPSSDPH